MYRMDRRSALLTGLAALAGSGWAQHEGKPIRIVVPYPAGSAPDIVARTLSEPLAAELGAPVVVENLPGARPWGRASRMS